MVPCFDAGMMRVEPGRRPGCVGTLGGLLRTCHVVDYNCYARVTDVAWNQAPETLLACCVPQLESYGAVVKVHCLSEFLISPPIFQLIMFTDFISSYF